MHYRENVGFFGRDRWLNGHDAHKPKSTLLTQSDSGHQEFAAPQIHRERLCGEPIYR
jgi:hypothetical protein